MKSKNFKIRATALIAAGSLMLSLSGCGNPKPRAKKYVFQDTLFDSAVLADVDDDLSFVKVHDSRFYLGNSSERTNVIHNHYFDIINGEYLTDCVDCSNQSVRKVDSIKIAGAIKDYLTEEELLRAINSELTTEETVAIISRIIEEEKENKLVLEK